MLLIPDCLMSIQSVRGFRQPSYQQRLGPRYRASADGLVIPRPPHLLVLRNILAGPISQHLLLFRRISRSPSEPPAIPRVHVPAFLEGTWLRRTSESGPARLLQLCWGVWHAITIPLQVIGPLIFPTWELGTRWA